MIEAIFGSSALGSEAPSPRAHSRTRVRGGGRFSTTAPLPMDDLALRTAVPDTPLDSPRGPLPPPPQPPAMAGPTVVATMDQLCDLQQGAPPPRQVSWAKEFRLLLDRHLPTLTRRLAADGYRYTWGDFSTYYGEHARAMWQAALEREERMARPGRSGALALPVERRRSWRAAWRWRSFVCSMASCRVACRGAVMRQMVDKRIDSGPCPRWAPPKDWPEAPAVPPPWKDFLMEEV